MARRIDHGADVDQRDQRGQHAADHAAARSRRPAGAGSCPPGPARRQAAAVAPLPPDRGGQPLRPRPDRSSARRSGRVRRRSGPGVTSGHHIAARSPPQRAVTTTRRGTDSDVHDVSYPDHVRRCRHRADDGVRARPRLAAAGDPARHRADRHRPRWPRPLVQRRPRVRRRRRAGPVVGDRRHQRRRPVRGVAVSARVTPTTSRPTECPRGNSSRPTRSRRSCSPAPARSARRSTSCRTSPSGTGSRICSGRPCRSTWCCSTPAATPRSSNGSAASDTCTRTRSASAPTLPHSTGTSPTCATTST